MRQLPGFRLRHSRAWRALRGLMAACLAFSVLSLVAATQGQDLNASVPEIFQVAAPHVGDKGTYQFTVTKQGLLGDAVVVREDAAAMFEVVEPRIYLARDGTFQVAHAVRHMTRGFGVGEGMIPIMVMGAMEGSFDTSGWYLLWDPSHGTHVGTEKQWELDKITGQGDASFSDRRWLNETQLVSPPPGAHRQLDRRDICGLAHPLQFQSLPTTDPVRIFHDCDLAGRTLYDSSFRATSAQVRQGEVCVLYEGLTPLPDETVTALFCPSIPYPVHMTVEHEAYGAVSQYRLIKFERGHSPPILLSSESSAPKTMAWGPLHPWGPDESGVIHPFLASEAYSFAASTEPAVADFLQRGSTFLLWTRYEERLGEKPDHVWSFMYASENGTLQLEVARSMGLEPSEDSTQVISSKLSSKPLVAGERFSPPPTVPRLQWMFEQWQAWQQTEVTPNGWAVNWDVDADACQDLLKDRQHLDESLHDCPWIVTIQVGITRVSNLTPVGEGKIKDKEEATIRFDQDGRVRSYRDYRMTQRATAAPGASQPAANSDGVASASVQAPDLQFHRTTLLIGLISAAIGVLVGSAPLVQKFGALAFFSRIQKPKALEHPIRAQIVEAVAAQPGIHFGQLCDRLNIPRSTLEHHLRRLVSHDLLRQSVGNGFACYFTSSGPDRAIVELAPYLKSERVLNLLKVVEAEPMLSAGEAASRLGVDPSTAAYHIKRMKRLNAVIVHQKGKTRRLSLTPTGRAGLEFLRTTT